MKKALVVFVALLTLAAFAGGALAQAPPKTDKPAAAPAAPAPEKAAPAPAPEKPKPAAEKPKAKPAAPKPVTGTVAAYEAGKMIAIKVKDKEMMFDIAPDVKIKGEVKEGAKATVAYKKDGDKMVATSISVPVAKKEAAPKKPAEKPLEKK